jgi:hypothetical protein
MAECEKIQREVLREIVSSILGKYLIGFEVYVIIGYICWD